MANSKYAFFEGKIVPFSEANISIATHAIHYGTAAFGGLRGYWNEDEEELFVFRPVDHFTRLMNSAKLLRMNLPYTPQTLVPVLTELLRKEGLRSRMILQVHDELVLEVPEEEVDRALALVKEVMSSAYPLDVPLKVDAGVGQHWGEVK